MDEFMESVIEHRGNRPVPRCGYWLARALAQGLVRRTEHGIVPTEAGHKWYQMPLTRLSVSS